MQKKDNADLLSVETKKPFKKEQGLSIKQLVIHIGGENRVNTKRQAMIGTVNPAWIAAGKFHRFRPGEMNFDDAGKNLSL